MEIETWESMYTAAYKVLMPRQISPFINAGAVSCALVTTNGNLYLGVCIDTACTLGICAERNAIATMITQGEHQIVKLLCMDSMGNILSPCGACREYLMQLDLNHKNMEILQNFSKRTVITLEQLIPNWWGNTRWKNFTP
ncbi:MAG: cytidine deaminase [Tatlockia sp.]|nr:cytidine deaminase [Tatlockia sp.]